MDLGKYVSLANCGMLISLAAALVLWQVGTACSKSISSSSNSATRRAECPGDQQTNSPAEDSTYLTWSEQPLAMQIKQLSSRLSRAQADPYSTSHAAS